MADHVIDTSNAKADGLDKCPKCGSTEISLRPSTGMLVCHFCRHEWSEATIDEKFGLDAAIGDLQGTVVTSGALGGSESTDDVLTLKCAACGAEVIVNTAEALQSRCHWCRQTLSVNQQVHNGAVPDGLLPFSIVRDDAIARISHFVKKRSFFAHPKFVKEFAPSEVVGVYMPYFLLDANTHIDLTGFGEVLTRSYTRKRGDDEVRLYDADVYQVARSFDLHIDDAVIESSGQRADIDWQRNTNNIINSIQPFDVKAAVEYNANYLRGFTSEKRDLDVTGLSDEAYGRALSIGRARVESSIGRYDRGVRWETEHLDVKGTRWVSLYLPVWLYSYYDGRLTHFVAVNGRTGETMGSVPLRYGRLTAVSVGIGVIGTVVGGFLALVLG